MIDDEDHTDEEDVQDDGPSPCVLRCHAVDEPEHEGDEVVPDLLLRDLGGAQPDDRQEGEQPDPERHAERAVGDERRHREEPDVHPDEAEDEILALVAREIDAVRERGDRDEVDAQADQEGLVIHALPSSPRVKRDPRAESHRLISMRPAAPARRAARRRVRW